MIKLLTESTVFYYIRCIRCKVLFVNTDFISARLYNEEKLRDQCCNIYVVDLSIFYVYAKNHKNYRKIVVN